MLLYIAMLTIISLNNKNNQGYRNLQKVPARRTWLLTGTPIQNSLPELFAILEVVFPDVFKDVDPEALLGDGGSRERNLARIRRIVAPFYLRRLKSDVQSQLPAKTSTTVTVPMPAAQRELYDRLLAEFRDRTNTVQDKFVQLRKATNHPLLLRRQFTDATIDVLAKVLVPLGEFGPTATVKQAVEELRGRSDYDLHLLCCDYPELTKYRLPTRSRDDPFPIAASAKLDHLREVLLPALKKEGRRVLLFSQWTTILDVLEHALGDEYKTMRLDGSTPMAERQAMIEEWNGGDAFIFFLTTRAGGLGLNLTGADTVILHDQDVNPAVDRQAEDRCHRVGQTKHVRVIRLVAGGSVDQRISELLAHKLSLNEGVIGEGVAGGDEIDVTAFSALKKKIEKELFES